MLVKFDNLFDTLRRASNPYLGVRENIGWFHLLVQFKVVRSLVTILCLHLGQ